MLAVPVTKVLRAYRAEKADMADKVVLAEDSYLAGCAYFRTAYHRRSYRHMEAFAAVCHPECHAACYKDYRLERHEACRKDYRRE